MSTHLPAPPLLPGRGSQTSTAIPAIPEPQFCPENFQQLVAASYAMRKIRSAIRVATFDGSTIAIFATLSLLMDYKDPITVLLCLGLGVVAFVELRCARRLARLVPGTTRIMALNQLALAGLLILYAGSQIWLTMRRTTLGPGVISPETADALQQLGMDAAPLVKLIFTFVYGTLIFVAIFGQGGLALYYYLRGKYVEAYIAKTPAWIIRLQRAGFS